MVLGRLVVYGMILNVRLRGLPRSDLCHGYSPVVTTRTAGLAVFFHRFLRQYAGYEMGH